MASTVICKLPYFPRLRRHPQGVLGSPFLASTVPVSPTPQEVTMNENDPATRAFAAKHAVALFSYYGCATSALKAHQIHEWARLTGQTFEAPGAPAPHAVAEQVPLRPMVDVEALDARVRREILATVFDHNRDGQLELLPAFLGEVETYVLGRVQRVERGHQPLVSSTPFLAYGERSPDQQAILRRLAMDVAHALLAIRFPLHVTSVEGFRLLDRADNEIAFWF
jgi:hypothetical protein